MEDKIFNAWSASFWEGEGYIGKYKNQLGYIVEIRQSIYPDRDVESCMKKIKERFGGHLYTHIPENKKHKTYIRWELGRQNDIKEFIKTIYPYCKFRKKQLKNALIYYEKHNIKKDVNIKVLKKLRRENKSYKVIAKILKISRGTIWYRFETDKCFNFWVNMIALQNILSSKI